MNQRQLKENLSYINSIKTCINAIDGFYHNNEFIDLISKILDDEIEKNKKNIENLKENNNDNWENNIPGYIFDVSSNYESFSDDDDNTSCYSDYDQDDLYDNIIENNNNNNWNDDDWKVWKNNNYNYWNKGKKLDTIFENEIDEKIQNIEKKYKRLGVRSFDFHKNMNDHH